MLVTDKKTTIYSWTPQNLGVSWVCHLWGGSLQEGKKKIFNIIGKERKAFVFLKSQGAGGKVECLCPSGELSPTALHLSTSLTSQPVISCLMRGCPEAAHPWGWWPASGCKPETGWSCGNPGRPLVPAGPGSLPFTIALQPIFPLPAGTLIH